MDTTRPLDGFRVLDLTANVAGPLACQVLVDLGAEVVKVEPPEGEAARRITASASGLEHVTPYFSPNNRGKLSVQLDLSGPEGVDALSGLIRSVDVLVQGMRPGSLDRKGLGPDRVAEINPHCIYASISAYGGGSHTANRAGIDMTVQAEAGCLSDQAAAEPARLIPFQLIDGATGHVLAQAILAALLHRARFGVVNSVEVAMYDVACSLQANILTLQMNQPPDRPRDGRMGRHAVAVAPSGVFPTGQGDIVLAAYVPAHWSRLVQVIGRPDLADDPRFIDQAARSSNSNVLREILETRLATAPAGEWVSRLDAAGLMAASINRWDEVVRSDLFKQRALGVQAVQDGRDLSVLRTPARYSSFDTNTHAQVPGLGEHNRLLTTTSRRRDPLSNTSTSTLDYRPGA